LPVDQQVNLSSRFLAFSVLAVPCWQLGEKATSAHFRVQLTRNGEHGIANQFGFEPVQVVSPIEMVVGIQRQVAQIRSATIGDRLLTTTLRDATF